MSMVTISAKEFFLVCPTCGRIEDLYVVLRLRFDFGCSRCKTSFKEFDAMVDSSRFDPDDWWK